MHAARKYLDMILQGVEVVLSIFLAIVLGILAFRLFADTFGPGATMIENAEHYIEKVMDLAIGIEFAKMLFHHTPGTIIEVLLFAISRHMIVEKNTALETMLGVVAIAALFAIKKYLLSSFRDHERIICPGQTTLRRMNLRYGITIPGDPTRMLCDVVREHCKVQNLPVQQGVSFTLADATMKIEEMRSGSIKKVEIVKVRSIFDE